MDTSQKRDNHTPSCAVCQKRKVKCNRVFPCAPCIKSGLECYFNAPRKRAKRSNQAGGSQPESRQSIAAGGPSGPVHSGYLRNTTTSTDIASPESNSNGSTVSSNVNGTITARLASDGRVVVNHLWTALDTSNGSNAGFEAPVNPPQAEISLHTDVPRSNDTAIGRSFLFGNSQSPADTSAMFPANHHIVYLWQVYCANIDPVMKLSHAPSVQHIVLGQIARPTLSRNEQALTSAIYFLGVVSLTDDQCCKELQDTRTNLLLKYRNSAENALSAAGFVTTTDVIVLQALVLYLAALRSLGEFQTVWSLFGLAIRIAGTLGLSRDGTSFNLSPFETEMRRRLWWGLVYFDGRMAELVGQEGDLMGNDYETGPPANLNDSDLFPTMTRLPDAGRVPTEAIYLQARVLCMTVARSLQNMAGQQGTWHKLQDGAMPTSEKLLIMQRIERRYQEEILEPCDPTVPLQWLSINTARTFATKLRLVARIPVVDIEGEWENVDGFSENAFILSQDLLQLQLDLWCEPAVQQWRWHWQAHFQWYALVSLLRQTRLRQSGGNVTRAWKLIKMAFEIIIPSLELGPRKSLLLDGIHALLNAAKRHQDQQSGVEKTSFYRPVLPSPNFKPLDGLSSGYVPRSHVPALDFGRVPTPPNFGRNILADHPDPVLGINLDAIDWTEFDRLASELCQQ